MAAFGLTVGAALAASGFVDVADNHRASAEITAAHQVGVFQGYGDGTFRPDLKLTRGQAELVIHRMLTWQGTDDDGNFEISRADAAVLAMSGLCGLDPDRIPACAAVGAASAAEVQAAYDRGYDNGFDDGLDAAAPTGSAPTGSTPPPVTAPAEPATAAEKCDAKNIHSRPALSPTYNGGWFYNTWIDAPMGRVFGPTYYTKDYHWIQDYAADFEDGYVCAIEFLHYSIKTYDSFTSDSVRSQSVYNFVSMHCWLTRIDPASGLKYEVDHLFISNTHPNRYLDNDQETRAINAAIAGDRPDPDLWPEYDLADCLTNGKPVP